MATTQDVLSTMSRFAETNKVGLGALKNYVIKNKVSLGLFTGINLLQGEGLFKSAVKGVAWNVAWNMFPKAFMAYGAARTIYSTLSSIAPGLERMSMVHDPHSYTNFHTRTQEAQMTKQMAMGIMDYHSRMGHMAATGVGNEATMLHRNY